MASPFSIFRKNQKVLIAVLGVLAMFAFVFLPIIMQGMGGKGTTDPVVVKTTKFGNLQASYLAYLRNNHLRVLNLLGQLGAMGAKAEIEALLADGKISADYAAMLTFRMSPEAVRHQYESEERFGPATPANVAKSWLLARQAEQTGMIISEDMIRAFIRGVTENRVKTADIQAVLAHDSLTADGFFSLMRDELLALEFRNEFRVSLYAMTPGQRWDYFNRVKRMATIEALPVAVANYVKQVPDPKDETLKSFFEENKERYPSPESPEPGFHRPHKVALEYFRADYDKFATPQTVTDAEIQQEYEKNKEYYDQFIEKSGEKEPLKKQDKPVEKKDQKPAEKKELKPAKEPEKKPEKKKDSKAVSSNISPLAPAEGPSIVSLFPPADGQSIVSPLPLGEGQGVRAARAAGQVAVLSHDRPHPNPLPVGEGTAVGSAPVVLTAFAQDKKTDDKPQPPAKAVEPVKRPEADAKGGKPAEKTPDVAKGASPAPKGEGTKAEPPKTGLPGLPAPVLSEAMKNRIRRHVAQAKARERILKVFERLSVPLDQYGEEWSKYDVERITSQGAAGGGQKPLGPPPPRPDFGELAKQNHLATGHTDLIAQWQAEGLEIGLSQAAQVNSKGEFQLSGRAPIWKYAFQSLPAFRPQISADGTGLYLLWKTNDEKDHVPKFDDEGVGDEVLHAWKMIEARKLAIKQAKSLAAEADKAQKPLKQVFADRPDLRVVLPPKFSWMTFGNLASLESVQYARLSTVPGVEFAGEEFMRAVFGLEKPGQVAVAFNAPKTNAYVVQLTEFSPVYEVRKSLFEVDDFRKYAAVAAEDQKQITQAWLKEIENSAGFEWTPGHNPEQISDSGQPLGRGGPVEPDQSGED